MCYASLHFHADFPDNIADFPDNITNFECIFAHY